MSCKDKNGRNLLKDTKLLMVCSFLAKESREQIILVKENCGSAQAEARKKLDIIRNNNNKNKNESNYEGNYQ